MKLMIKMKIAGIDKIESSVSSQSQYKVSLEEYCILGDYRYNTVVVYCEKDGLCDKAIQNKHFKELGLSPVVTTDKHKEQVQYEFRIVPNNKSHDSLFMLKTPTILDVFYTFDSKIKNKEDEKGHIINNVSAPKAQEILIESFSELLFGNICEIDSYWWSGSNGNDTDAIKFDFEYEDN